MEPIIDPLTPLPADSVASAATLPYAVKIVSLPDFKALAYCWALLALTAVLVWAFNGSGASAFLFLSVLGYSLGKTVEKVWFVATHPSCPRKVVYALALVTAQASVVGLMGWALARLAP